MSSSLVACERCGTAVQLTPGQSRPIHCRSCEKLAEQDELQAWASQWAQSLVEEGNEHYFFTALAAAWEQGFIKARTFEDGVPAYEVPDNPFSPEIGQG